MTHDHADAGVERYDAVVIGAGAAGMMCAATAGRRGRRVLLIEHYTKLGEKIRISGGGRCNFTNLYCRPEHYLSQNPDFCRSALARFGPRDFIALLDRDGIAYHEKTLGQLFCDRSALDIIALLKSECDRGGVQWRMPCQVEAVERAPAVFRIRTDRGRFEAPSLVIATGGLTVPKIGATPFGYRIAAQFGLAVVPPRPALVPLACGPEFLARFGALAGVSVDCVAMCGGGNFREALLFTHRGLSGPAILQVSSYWQAGEIIEIDLLPQRDAAAWLLGQRGSRQRLDNLLAEAWPKRLAQAWCEAVACTQPIHTLSETRLRQVASDVAHWRIVPSGTLGYNKAEVTRGGVDTRGLSSRTMGAMAVPGLYFIGEVVDVTGHLGGFNFQWAWASGHAAGEAL
jgi:predicted Rossmann fold flavoprotein